MPRKRDDRATNAAYMREYRKRNAEATRAYTREYMRQWRAARRASSHQP